MAHESTQDLNHRPFQQNDDAETFEIALGKSKHMEDDHLLVEDETLYQDNDSQREYSENEEEKQGRPRRCCCPHINTSLLPYKGFYFFFLAAIGSLIPFLAVFYKQLWLSAKQTGILLGMGPLIKMVAIPMWGIIVDFYKKTKFIFIMSLLAWLVAYYSISLVSPVFHLSICKDNSTLSMTEDIIDSFTNENIVQSSSQNNISRRFGTKASNHTTFLKDAVKANSKAGEFLRKLRQRLHKKHHHITQTELAADVLSLIENNNYTDPNITEIAKALTRDKIERVFDFLNMQGHYPWPLDTVANFKKTQNSEEWENDRNTYLFTILFVITAVGTLLASPSLTLADIATLQKLGKI